MPEVNTTHFALAAPFVSQLTLEFNIRDMKYLSNANSTVITTTDPAVMYGTANLTFPINFQTILDQDASGATYFVVGGRAYFEASVYGQQTQSFTTRGFFD